MITKTSIPYAIRVSSAEVFSSRAFSNSVSKFTFDSISDSFSDPITGSVSRSITGSASVSISVSITITRYYVLVSSVISVGINSFAFFVTV